MEASAEARAFSRYLQLTVKPLLAAARSPQDAAAILDQRRPGFPAPRSRAIRIGGVDAIWLDAEGPPKATLLYFHGGAYFSGAPALCGPVLNAFAASGFNVLAPAYRLAPEHPFPAAVGDAHAAYAALLNETSAPVVLAGDSAGGGLALAVMVAARDARQAMPRAAALFSPWTDLAATGASIHENEEKDALFTRVMLRVGARAYLSGASAKTPLASPLYADLAGLPPILVHVGEDEMLRDDSTRLVERAHEASVGATLRLWPAVPHCWQLYAPHLREAQMSLDEAAAFLAEAATR